MAVNYILPITMTSKNTNALTGNFDLVNASGLDEACSIVRIVNDSNRDLTVSYDGITEHDYVIAGTTLQLYGQASAQPAANVSLFRKGQKIWVKGTAGGTGFVYLVAYYNRP